jgi:hypothetical protein
MKIGFLTLSAVMLLMITIAITGSALFYIYYYYEYTTSKAITQATLQPRCIESCLTMYFANVGRSPLYMESPPNDYLAVKNLISNAGFEDEEMETGWETQNNIDVMLLIDKSTSMTGGAYYICNTSCDVLGYNESTAYCRGETYPYCEDCDGRSNPLLSLPRRKEDVYADHSVPDNIHYEWDCPYNEARFGAINFTGYMDPETDRVGIISFSKAKNEYNPGDMLAELNMSLSNDTFQAINTIDLLAVGQYTGIAAAIRRGTDHLQAQPPSRKAVKIQILLTDGKETMGGNITKDGEVSSPVQEAQKAADEEIVIYTIGFGPSADADTLQQIANITDGTYYYAATGEQLQEIYKDIAIEIFSSIDKSKSVYGNKSMKLPAFSEAYVYSKPVKIDYNSDYMLSHYLKIEGLEEGSVGYYLHLYRNKQRAEILRRDAKITLNIFNAPLDDFNFTKFSDIINKDQLDDNCRGKPCQYARLVYEWSKGQPKGTLWADDIFLGPNMEYFQTISTREATLGEITIVKIDGDGDLYPYVDKAKIEAGESSQLKDANCAGEECKYLIMVGASVVDFKALC